MITQHFVVEGKFDQFILKHILPEEIVSQIKFFVVNGGYTRALSIARSLLVSSELPVSLFVDSDTTDRNSIEEKKDFISQSLQQLSAPDRFDIFFAVPEIEAIFFSNREIVEELIGKKISDEEWELAQYHPKKTLFKLLHINFYNLANFHGLLTPTLIEKLRKTEFIQNIIKNSQIITEK